MKCPICNIELNRSDRQGLEIDYCPQCGGIWLDRGELDEVIERSVFGNGANGTGLGRGCDGGRHLTSSGDPVEPGRYDQEQED